MNITNVEVELQNRSLLGLGVASYYLNNYKDAVASLSEIDIREPNFEKDKLNFYLAENLFALGNYEQAVLRYNNVDQGIKSLAARLYTVKLIVYLILRSMSLPPNHFQSSLRSFLKMKRSRMPDCGLPIVTMVVKIIQQLLLFIKIYSIRGKPGWTIHLHITSMHSHFLREGMLTRL